MLILLALTTPVRVVPFASAVRVLPAFCVKRHVDVGMKKREDDDLGWWDSLLRNDVDGPLQSSERWAMYSMPVGFALATIVLTSLTSLFPNTPGSWLTFFALLLAWDAFSTRSRD